MDGLESDQILDFLWLGTIGDANYQPYLKHHNI